MSVVALIAVMLLQAATGRPAASVGFHDRLGYHYERTDKCSPFWTLFARSELPAFSRYSRR